MRKSLSSSIKELQDKHNREMQELRGRINEQFAEKQAKIMLHVAMRIKELRHERGMTQQDLAERVGMSRTSITNMEKPNQDFPLSTLIKIAIALGVEMSVFFIKYRMGADNE